MNYELFSGRYRFSEKVGLVEQRGSGWRSGLLLLNCMNHFSAFMLSWDHHNLYSAGRSLVN